MLNIRRARAQEAEALTRLAIQSEAYWGYDSAYMQQFQSMYAVTESFINSHPVFVLEKGGLITGFYAFQMGKKETSLEFLYIDPSCIGLGYGKLLWDHAVKTAEGLGIKEFVIVTSPQAKGFYLKMGAVLAGEVESLVKKGRMIPQFIYRLE
jgi:ribosomal protein S18 acetylase RimI-like enzyme